MSPPRRCAYISPRHRLKEQVPTVRKIPTLFVRDLGCHVTTEVTPGCEWVLAGEGVATRKYDGTCVMFDGLRWWARREVKPGKTSPANFQPIETDSATGKTVGWEPIEQSAFSKFHAEAWTRWVVLPSKDIDRTWPAGTYELVGPKVNGNPENLHEHRLIKHGTVFLRDVPRDHAGIRAFLLSHDFEGVVWHHQDGRMVKIKKRDFS